jgi:hypothetical protein
MKSFKSIREGNSVEPGVSEINDVPEDPMSFVEIKPKKAKAVKESINEAEIIQEELHRVNVSLSDPNHQMASQRKEKIQKIVKLKALDKEHALSKAKQYYKDRGYKVHDAEHVGIVIEEAEQMDELNKDTVYSYAAKAGKDVDKKHKDLSAQIKSNKPQEANKTSSKIGKRYAGMDRAETRLNKEDTVLETKSAPKGFHFTKDGKLKRGDAVQDGNGGPMLRTDPLDKQRNKVPAVSEGVDFFKVWESIKPVEIVVEEEAVDPIVLKREADILMASHIAAHKAK